MLKKPLFTRKNQDCTAKNQIEKIVFNYRFTGNSRLYNAWTSTCSGINYRKEFGLANLRIDEYAKYLDTKFVDYGPELLQLREI